MRVTLNSVRSDGSDERELVNLTDFREADQLSVREISLSPDGSSLLLDGRHVVNVDGTGFISLGNYGLGPGYASWSPDGSRITVYYNPKVDGRLIWRSIALVTLAPDGSDVRVLLRYGKDGLELGYGGPPNPR